MSNQETFLTPHEIREKQESKTMAAALSGTVAAAPAIDVEVDADGRTNVIAKSLSASEELLVAVKTSDDNKDDDNNSTTEKITLASDLSNLQRRIWIVTTAGLPWRTGTAVNPLLRALQLTIGRPPHYVTLLIPWLADKKDRAGLFGKHQAFENSAEQEEWIRQYCRDRCGGAEQEKLLRIQFWQGRYHEGFGSIFPMVDICSLIPKEEADVAILEEPEHLNWFRYPKAGQDDADVLGWQFKFNHVVGILHTNYDAYVRDYSWGTFATAPALHSLSAMVVRAYCTRLIRLSAALPSLDARTEVTSNVHGVRPEFLAPPQQRDPKLEQCYPIYFIGKLIWAKGFDHVLEVQEKYKEATGEYFAMDVYGGGADEAAIKRAFFGRTGECLDESSRPSSPFSDSEEGDGARSPTSAHSTDVFGKPVSLRSQLQDSAIAASLAELALRQRQKHERDSELQSSHAMPVIETAGEDDALAAAVAAVKSDDPDGDLGPVTHHHAPLDILGDLSGSTMQTGAETAGAAFRLVESLMQTGLGTFGKRHRGDGGGTEAKPKTFRSKRHFGPGKSRFKWRKVPVQARFLGVKDHCEIRDISEQKIFINCSTTEVLCTTSAEALAMGKFVILPKHPSNEFFYQFKNCLAFTDYADCVEKIKFALKNNPEPLDDETAHVLSWEGATERLYKASAITAKEAEQRKAAHMDEACKKAARFHVESARKSQYLANLFTGKMKAPSSANSLAPSG